MNKNKNNKAFLAGNIIYLIVIFIFIMLYVAFVYPLLSDKIIELESKQTFLETEIRILTPHENNIANITQKAREATEKFEQSDALAKPVLFSDILYKIADQEGMNIKNLSIAENGSFALDETTAGAAHLANITISVPSGKNIASFLSTLEKDTSAGFYVTNLNHGSYTTSELAVQEPEDDSLEGALPEITTQSLDVTLTISMYTVSKE